jgi:hypothetical protein
MGSGPKFGLDIEIDDASQTSRWYENRYSSPK